MGRIQAILVSVVLGLAPGGPARAEAAAPTAVAAPKAAPRAAARAERIRGDVTRLRAGRSIALKTEAALIPGDTLRTGREGRLRIVLRGGRVDVAPGSVVTLSGTGILYLPFGHVRAVGPAGGGQGKAGYQIRTPGALIGVHEAELLVHVTRSPEEFSRRLAGHWVVQPPAPDALEKIVKSRELYAQIGCLAGSAPVKARNSDQVLLKAGEIIRVHGGTAEFAPLSPGLGEVRSVRQSLGFPED